MSLRDLYRQMADLTPAQRALFAERLKRRGLERQTGVTRSGRRRAPLSLVQRRLWFLDQLEPGNPSYNLPILAFELHGALDFAALQGALAETERRHESLRTVFQPPEEERAENAGHRGDKVEAEQVVLPVEAERPLPRIDLSKLATKRRDPAVRRIAFEESRHAFDLSSERLWRTRLVVLEKRRHLLLVLMHHIVSDAWSLGVFFRELTALYRAFHRGAPSPLPEPPIQYADFAAWQTARLSDEVLERELAAWKELLRGAPFEFELPTDRPRPAVRSSYGRRLVLGVTERLADDMAAACDAMGVSLFMMALSIAGAWFYRHTGRRDILMGSPVAGRSLPEAEKLIGFFVNTVVMRMRLSGHEPFRHFLERVRDTVLEVFEHQELPFDRLVEALEPKRDPSRSPIFQVMATLQNTDIPDLELAGLEVRELAEQNHTSQTDLIFFSGAKKGRLTDLEIEYCTALFDDTTIQRMGQRLQTLIDAVLSDPEVRVADLAFLGGVERRQLLEEWNGSSASPDLAQPDLAQPDLARCFEARADAVPDAVALVAGERCWSYARLERLAGRLAGRLRRAGVGPEVPVALFLGRDLEMVTAMLATWKAGGFWTVFEAGLPEKRRARLVADAGVRVVVTDETPAPWCGDARIVSPRDRPESTSLRSRTAASCAAYVIYTSGSTGRPKGVVVSHLSVAFFLEEAWRRFGLLEPAAPRARPQRLSSDDVWSVFHSFAFDFSVWELWGALLSGGRAVLVSDEARHSPPAFRELLERERVTVIHQTPAALFALLEAALPHHELGSLALRSFCVGGEALDPGRLDPWLRAARAVRWHNVYGTTETTVLATARRLEPGAHRRPARGSDVGAPFAGYPAYVIDRDGRLAPLGVDGELWIGGAGVARGYLGAPRLTAQRFVPDAFPHAVAPPSRDGGRPRGGRLYRTGDLARRRADGGVEFLGRIDHQVKLRGRRIELGEIESLLGRHPEVRTAVARLRKGPSGDPRLIAWVVPKTDEPPARARRDGEAASFEPGELRAFLAVEVPAYMLPSAILPVAELPLTRSGKLDLTALPDPVADRNADGADSAVHDSAVHDSAVREYIAPRTPTEKAVARVWAELLGVREVGAGDDFFELGGHSLLATQVTTRLSRELEVEIPLRLVFDRASVRSLAEHIDQARAAGERKTAAPEPALVRRTRTTRRRKRGGRG